MKAAILSLLCAVMPGVMLTIQAATVKVNTAKITVTDFKADSLDPPSINPTTKTASVEVNDTYGVANGGVDAFDYHVIFELPPFKGRALVNGDQNEPFGKPKVVKSGDSYNISWDSAVPVAKGKPVELLFSVQIPLDEHSKILVTDAYWTDKDHRRISNVPVVSSICLALTGLAGMVCVGRVGGLRSRSRLKCKASRLVRCGQAAP